MLSLIHTVNLKFNQFLWAFLCLYNYDNFTVGTYFN